MTDASGDDILLTKAVRSQLRAERARTGVTAIQLLGDAGDLPDGLTPGLVNRWMNGLMRGAPREQFNYVVARWAALPDATSRKRGKTYPTSSGAGIDVTLAMASDLRAELARTGVDHAALLDVLSDVPAGLNARVIKGWLYRHAATCRTAHWSFVIGHLHELPDRVAPLPPLRRKRRKAPAISLSATPDR